MRAVAFPIQNNPQVLATGGQEKKLRIFDLSRTESANGNSSIQSSSNNNANNNNNNSNNGNTGSSSATSYEIGPGVHKSTIKSIVWNQDYNILTTAAEDGKIRWWDLRSRHPVVEYNVEGTIGSCELNTLATMPNEPGILSVAAGKSVYFFDGAKPGLLLKKVDFPYEVASVAVNQETGRFVTGGAGENTWARVYDLHSNEELGSYPFSVSLGSNGDSLTAFFFLLLTEVQKGHHGPIWSISYSPDGKLYGTGSEDGTIKLWKACREPYGLWR